ncbi:MAG: cytidylate kinase-like family protein [Planctomycetota bacterium]
MALITISRGSCSGGKEIAEKVAERLGYTCVAREILLEASAEFNVPEVKLVRAIHDAPTILTRLGSTKERYVQYIRTAFIKYMLRDNVVYHGLAGHFFLQGISHALKVRIVSDLMDRVQLEMERQKISREEPLALLRKDDEERRKWSRFLYGIDTEESHLYDLVINTKGLSTDTIVSLICHTVQRDQFRTTPESRKMLEERLKT